MKSLETPGKQVRDARTELDAAMAEWNAARAAYAAAMVEPANRLATARAAKAAALVKLTTLRDAFKVESATRERAIEEREDAEIARNIAAGRPAWDNGPADPDPDTF